MTVSDTYLILYNTTNAIGWSFVLFLILHSLTNLILSSSSSSSEEEETPIIVFQALSQAYHASLNGLLPMTLNITQSMALLEIVHAGLGLVRSPLFVTSMQVMSRIGAIYALSYSPRAQGQFGTSLMIISWCLAEIPRYLFYVSALLTGDATKKTPFPLFFLRYTSFLLLYPTGIIGELTVFYSASIDPSFLNLYGPSFSTFMYYFVSSPFVIYIIGAPGMILNMLANRKSAFKKRFAKPPPPPRGLVFPISTPSTSKKPEIRSSTPVAKSILSSSLQSVNPTKAERISNEKNWRFGYVKHLVGMIEEQCQSSETALIVAKSGLDRAYEVFEFISDDGQVCTFKEAMTRPNKPKYHTGFIKGEKHQHFDPKKNQLEVPYQNTILSGSNLRTQVEQWVSYGTIEHSAGEAIIRCIDHPSTILDLSDRYFVLLGAGSAMGPYSVLMSLGANVIAVDLDRGQIWKRLLSIAKRSGGTLTFPLVKPQDECLNEDEVCDNAGCNLFTDTPFIRDWVLGLYEGKDMTVGSYAYLNGALHVQVSLAMDAICKDLSEKRGASLAYLCTPTDLHLIPKEAHQASLKEYEIYSKKPYCILMNLLSGGKCLKKNALKPIPGDGGDFYLVNGISVAQGPNYALAKRMQHWRAILARNKHNCIVSSNIAPATSTLSVVQNRTFAWAYEGMPYFKPYEIFAPETSNAVMAALLLSDLNIDDNVGSVSNPKRDLKNPNMLFSEGSFHGGTWRCAYAVDSIGEASVLIYFGRLVRPYLFGLGGVALAFLGSKYF